MKIVGGVGCGPGMLTPEAATVIAGASLVYGSARAIALARDAIAPGSEVHEIEDYRSLRSLPAHAVVLSTGGDPMLAGLGYLPGEVVPGDLLAPGRVRPPEGSAGAGRGRLRPRGRITPGR
ncbi:hypothetical protein [Methanoculleus chikugoensis]|uniref:hypothetical protein n=1 Tax=Methanoculleus chikugoensis TaxID=118126 RepID=UPI000A491571|nr:hypothetical protein [Methanoculleus chikugoensis]